MTPADLTDPLLDATWKGFPPAAGALRRSVVGAQGWNVLGGDLPLPLAVVHRDALAHNLRWMQDLVARAGIDLAPHGKTTLSPQLFRAQLDAGAWGITVASVGQVGLAVESGARRVLIANQVLQAVDLAALAALRHAQPGLFAPFLLDSPAQLAAIEAWHTRAGGPPPDVLLELGLAGGRTGCRSDNDALTLARAARRSPAVRLVGIECYEGLWARGDDAADTALVDPLLARVHALAAQAESEGLFEGNEVLVTAGGSAVFDLVARALRPALRRPARALLRAGCYVTHDDGFYHRMGQVVNRRLGCVSGLQAALRVWSMVLSMPEPGLAVLGAGKRDLSFDMGMPVPLAVSPAGTSTVQAAPAHWQIDALNDQHAYLRLGGDAAGLRVGDRVALGISHPCATFDRWRWMAVVDDDLNVVDAITTCF